MPQFQSHGASVHYKVMGQGHPVLLIAGIASDGASWGPLIEPLARRYQVILIDNRGSGQTRCEGPLLVRDMVDDCAALFDHLGIEKAHVVGHSLGGGIAAWFAVRHAARVSKLVTMGFGPMSAQARQLFRDLADLYPKVAPPLFFRLLFQFLFKPAFFEDSATVAAAAEASTAYPFRQSPADFARQVAALDTFERYDIATITAPTLAIAGRHDLIAPPEKILAIHRKIADFRMVTIEGAAHSMHWDEPVAALDAVVEFLTASAPP